MAEQNIPQGLHKNDRDNISFLEQLIGRVSALESAASGDGDVSVSAFNELSDTFEDYTGKARKPLRVNAAEDGIEADTSTFTSTDQAITSAGTWTEAHGLGAAPTKLFGYLVCQSSGQGYTAGDVIAVPLGVGIYTEGGSSSNLHYYGVSVKVDATNITVAYVDETTSPGSTVFMHLNPSTGLGVFLVDANFKFRVVAAL